MTAVHPRFRTHCPSGHEYAGEHLYLDPSGRRHCVTCRNEKRRARRAAARALRDLRPSWVRELGPYDSAGTVLVPLSGGKAHAQVEAADLHLLTDRSWQIDVHGYAKSEKTVGGVRTKLYMHRVILDPGDGVEVDHINRDRLDNRRSNLRPACRHDQAGNMGLRSNNTSGYRGVSRTRSGAWGAWIRIGGRSTNLGVFSTAEGAAVAYDAAACVNFGEFANLNFPEAAA